MFDALPFEILSRRYRIAALAIVFANNSFSFVLNKIQTGKIYEDGEHLGHAVPEITVDGLTTISLVTLMTQSELVLALLALHMCYVCVKYSTQAVLIEKSIPLEGIRTALDCAGLEPGDTNSESPRLLHEEIASGTPSTPPVAVLYEGS